MPSPVALVSCTTFKLCNLGVFMFHTFEFHVSMASFAVYASIYGRSPGLVMLRKRWFSAPLQAPYLIEAILYCCGVVVRPRRACSIQHMLHPVHAPSTKSMLHPMVLSPHFIKPFFTHGTYGDSHCQAEWCYAYQRPKPGLQRCGARCMWIFWTSSRSMFHPNSCSVNCAECAALRVQGIVLQGRFACPEKRGRAWVRRDLHSVVEHVLLCIPGYVR